MNNLTPGGYGKIKIGEYRIHSSGVLVVIIKNFIANTKENDFK